MPTTTAATVGAGSTVVTPTTGAVTPTTTAPPQTTSTAPPAPPASGAFGYVTAGPTCPVERVDQPCPPRPVMANVAASDANGRTVASTTSDSSGRYTLALAPGSYTLSATTGGTYPRCSPVGVTVHSGPAVRADITCDTGIR